MWVFHVLLWNRGGGLQQQMGSFLFFEKFVSGKVDGFRVIMLFAGLQKVVLLDLRLRVKACCVYGFR